MCTFPLVDEETEAMTCGHVFHSICLRRYAEVQHLSLALLPCAICRLVAQHSSPGMDSHELQVNFNGHAGELQPPGGAPHEQENAVDNGVTIELSDAAIDRIAPSCGPMHGVHPKAKAGPRM